MNKKFLLPLVFLICGCSFSFSTSSISQSNGSIESTLESSKVDNDNNSNITSNGISSNDDNVSNSNITSSETSSNDDNVSNSNITSSETSSNDDNDSTSDITSSEISSSSEDLVPTEGLNFVDTLDYFRMMNNLPADYEFTDEELQDIIGDELFGLSLEDFKIPSYSVYVFPNEITSEEVTIPNSYNGRPVLITYIEGNENIKKMNIACKFAMLYYLPNLEEITSFNGNVALGVIECENLKKAIINNNIEYPVFHDCTNLNYNEYDNALYLGNDDNPYLALIKAKNEEITSCNINDKCKVLASYGAFDHCRSLTSITIPDSVTTIGWSAFAYCSSLTSVTIPDSVRTIGDCAFERCSSLLGVTIPSNVTTIGNCAFERCSSLTNITVDENNPNYKSIDGNLYTKDGSTLIQYAIGKTDLSFIIPDSVTSIGDSAFYYCSSLTSVTIGNNVTTIDSYAFSSCSSLLGVTIPSSVTTIGKWAFSGCSSLLGITIGNNVTSIGNYAFSGCSSLTSITYNGTIEQWNNISKGSGWRNNVPAKVVHCTDGDVAI